MKGTAKRQVWHVLTPSPVSSKSGPFKRTRSLARDKRGSVILDLHPRLLRCPGAQLPRRLRGEVGNRIEPTLVKQNFPTRSLAISTIQHKSDK